MLDILRKMETKVDYFKEEPAAKRNSTRPKKALTLQSKLKLYRVCDEGDDEFVEDPTPQMTVANFLKRIEKNPIMLDNAFPLIMRTLISDKQLKYAKYFLRDTKNTGMERKEVMQVLSYIWQVNYYIQADNNLDLLIRDGQLKNLNRGGWVVKYQTMTLE